MSGVVRVQAEVATPTLVAGSFYGLTLDTTGALRVTGGGGGGAIVVVGAYAPSDTQAQPTNLVGVESFPMAYNRAANTYGRVDRGDLTTGGTAIANASAGAGMKVQAYLYGQKANVVGVQEWIAVGVQNNGTLLVGLLGDQANVDNVNLSGTAYELTGGPAQHRNQAGNWYLTRGGYNGVISAAALPAIINHLPAGAMNTAAPAPANGELSALQVDAGANLLMQIGRPAATSRATPDPYREYGLTRSVIKASAGNLLSVVVSSQEATAQLWFQLFNTASAPSGGATPVLEFFLGSLAESPGNVLHLGREFFSEAGVNFATGVAWAVSTTANTLTLPGSFVGGVSGTYV